MQVDSELGISILDIAKRVLDLDLRAFLIGEEIVAHSEGPVSVGGYFVVLESHLCPALYRETLIFGASVV